jgi:hypothetical protein
VKSSPTMMSIAILCASFCLPASATMPKTQAVGLTAPPPASKVSAKSKPVALRLPSQAGKVSKVVATSLVAKSPSWIAKGDKYYSLCVPNRRLVSCAPIVPARAMKDIEVGAEVGAKGEPILTFKIASNTQVAPKRVQYAIRHFLARTKRQAAHFDRMAVSYAPRAAQSSVRIGATSSLVDASEGSGGITCSYDDEGSYDCTGGSYRGGSGDGGSDPIPGTVSIPDEPGGQCLVDCDYPSGNDNGAEDPCIDGTGNNICQVVQIPGRRPPAEESVELVSCRPVNPFVVECGRIPPVIGGVPQELPRAVPWFPQSWCDNVHILCSAGQQPSDSGKTYDQLLAECEAQHVVDTAYCDKNESAMDSRMVEVCFTRADRASLACREKAKVSTSNGQHVVP